jgi:hypothetical protein
MFESLYAPPSSGCPCAVPESQALLAREIYEGLSSFLGQPPAHGDFVAACRSAGLGVPEGLVKESLWVMAARVVVLSHEDLTSLAPRHPRV